MANYELRIETSNFKKALDVLSTVVNKKVALPILACTCIRYNREKKLFTMTASNTEQWIEIECTKPDGQGEKGRRPWMFLDKDERQTPFDAVCFNVEDFREAFSTLASMPCLCYLTLNEDGGSLTVNHNKGRFVLPVHTAIDFPPVPAVVERDGEQREGVSPVVKFSRATAELLPAIAAARCCAAADELRPVMNTVCLDAFQDHLIVVASDGHSLYRRSFDTGMGWLKYGLFPVDQSAKLLIPTQALSPLMKSMATAETFTLTADTQRIRIESGDGEMSVTTRSMEGRFPNYDSVIPKQPPHTLVVDRAELAATLRRISIFSSEASNLAILRRDDDRILLQANDDSYGRSADEQVTIINPDCTLEQGFQIGFKISTMLSLLGCIQTDNVSLRITDPGLAMLLKEDQQISALTLLVMPMLVNT